MWLLAVALYFVLACAASWMLLFPSGREIVVNALAGAGKRLRRLPLDGPMPMEFGATFAAQALPPLRRRVLPAASRQPKKIER